MDKTTHPAPAPNLASRDQGRSVSASDRSIFTCGKIAANTEQGMKPMFDVETYTARAIDAYRGAVETYGQGSANLRARMTAAFVAILAANGEETPKTASKLLSEKVPGSKLPGNVVGKYRSHNVAFFTRTQNLNAMRRAIGDPSAMTAEAFAKACDAYAAGINPTVSYERKAEKGRKEKAALKEAAKTAHNVAVAEDAANAATVGSQASGHALAALATLLREAFEGTTESRADAEAGLDALSAALSAGLEKLRADQAEAQAKAA